MKAILSLFDHSGSWAAPYEKNGWEVIPWDIKLSEFMDIENFRDVETTLDLIDTGYYDIQGILAAVPCTDFTVSGAQYWGKKDANGTTAKSLELVYQVQRLADLFKPTDPDYFEENPESIFFWCMENPVGRLGKLTGMGKPYYFDPCDFAGYTKPTVSDIKQLETIRNKKGIGVTAEENDLVLRSNAYTKKTGLWGEFNSNLVKQRIEPVKTAAAGSPLMRLGGKSDKTKELRSITPAGFAEAFYNANNSPQCD